jgi:hypothetical protein
MAVIVLNGSNLCYSGKCGLYFFGVHSFDMVWHLALSAVSFSSLPFTVPNFSGALLNGYNYLMDLIVFPLLKLGFSNVFVYFKMLPVLWFFMFTVSLLRFGLALNKSPKFIALLLFLCYFTGSFGYLLTFWHHGTIWGSSGLVSMQALHALANMQFAFSLVVLLEVFILIKKDRLELKDALLFSLFISINLGLKFYGGIITVFLVGLFLLTKIVPFSKNTPKIIALSFIIAASAALSVIIFYNPFASTNTAGLFSFDPLATVHPIIESAELLFLPTLVDQRYALQGRLGPRLLLIEGFTIGAFLFFNFGIRLVGIVYELKRMIFRQIEKWEVLAFLTAVLATSLNMFFVQKGEWWNTVQFLYYGLFISTIFTALALFKLIELKKWYLGVFVALLILISLPIDVDLIRSFTSPFSMSFISRDELKGLQYLKNQPDGVVYTPLFQEKMKDNYIYPYPMFSNQDTPYISALTGKQVFLSTLLQLRILGINYNQRLNAVKSADCDVVKNITYAYIVREYRGDHFFINCIKRSKKFKVIFNNSEVTIYKKL